MDLWNNHVGRKYGADTQTRKELFFKLLEALKGGELIIDPEDPREYDGEITFDLDRGFPILVAKESATGENLQFYDFVKDVFMNKLEFLSMIKRGDYKNYEVRLINGEEVPLSKKDGNSNNNLG